jgi:CreA protein
MRTSLSLIAAGILSATPTLAQEVGSFANDWSGNDIVVEAVEDPEVKGVTCHISHFERGMIDRLRQGNWFEDPSNASISCHQTGPIVIGDIERDDEGEEVFNERKSLVFKNLAVRRLYDEARDTLIYVVYSREVVEGSAKMDISTVALHGADVTWENGKDQ